MDKHSSWKHFLMIGALFLVGTVIYIFADAARTTSKGGSGDGSVSAQCNDHVDNDSDGFCDYAWKRAYCGDGSTPGDPQCVSKDDTTEADSCVTSWQCSDWSVCTSGTQTRTCTDANNCGASSGKPSETQSCSTGGALDFSKIASLIKSQAILTKFPGFDLGNNGRREFIVNDFTVYSDVTTFRIYENTADNTYASVYTLPIDAGSYASYYPSDVGDSDGDGKQEILTFGRNDGGFYVRIYEASASSSYPDTKVWETPTGWWPVNAYFADLDKDGVQEVVFGGQDFNYENKIQVFENNGNNSYTKVFDSTLPDIHTSQDLAVFDDIDADGKREMAFCGLVPTGAMLYFFESAGNNSFVRVASIPLIYTDGQLVNCQNVVYAGDTDRDGRKEFIVGGNKSVPQLGEPFYNVFFVYEATSDNTFQKTYTVVKPVQMGGDSAIASSDLNGDGDTELILTSQASTDQVSVWDSSGDNQFIEAWTHVWSRPANVAEWLKWLGVGDHDGDGKAEIIFNEYNGSVSLSVFERI